MKTVLTENFASADLLTKHHVVVACTGGSIQTILSNDLKTSSLNERLAYFLYGNIITIILELGWRWIYENWAHIAVFMSYDTHCDYRRFLGKLDFIKKTFFLVFIR